MNRRRMLWRASASTMGGLGVVGALVASGVGASAGTVQHGNAHHHAKSAVVFGMAIAETGPYSAYDSAVKVMAELAAQRINATGGVMGHPIKLVFADTQSSISEAKVAAQTVIGEGAKAIITQCEYTHAVPSALVAQQKHVPAFSCNSDPAFGPQSIGQYAFGFTFGANEEGAVTAEYPYYKLHLRRAYFLEDTSIPYSTQQCQYAKKVWSALPGTSVAGTSTFENSDTSIAAQITAIKAATPAPTVLMFCSYVPGSITALKQLRGAGVNLPISTGTGQDYYPLLTGKAIPGLSNMYVISVASVVGHNYKPGVNQIFNEFKAKSGAPASSALGLFGYCMVQGWASAATAAHSFSGPAVVAQLQSWRKHVTACGPMTFSKAVHVPEYLPATVMKMQGGHVVQVAPFVPKAGSVPAA